MAALCNFILASFGLFLLTQCNNKEEDSGKLKATSSSVIKINESSFNGQWRFSIPFYYSELTIHDNGTFTYHDQGCYGQRFSQGSWTNVNNSIHLKSFDTFKQVGQAEKNNINKTDLTNIKSQYSYIGSKNIPPPVFPEPTDTIKVYFNRVELQLTNDTLFCISKERLPEDAKFYKTKNNR